MWMTQIRLRRSFDMYIFVIRESVFPWAVARGIFFVLKAFCGCWRLPRLDM
jgi:hypothetical protein